MKICLISNLYKPFIRGGAEKVVEMMAKGLVRQGFDLFIVSTKPTFGLTFQKEDNINIYRFRPLNLFYYLNDYKHNAIIRLFWHWMDVFNIHSALTIQKIIKKEKPSVIITHNLKGIGFLIPWIIRRQKIKHIHVLHDVQLSVPSGLIIKNKENSFLVSGWPTKIYEFACRKLFGSPDVVVSPSQWLRKFYLEKNFFLNSRTEVLHNPTDSLSFLETRALSDCFLFAGQLEKHKGIEWLINIWEKNNISSKLLIAGKGSLKLKTKNKNIEFLGQLTQEELRKKMTMVDFLILPSLCYENSPTIISQAFSIGTPAIVADIGGVGELVTENETGFVFESENEQSFLLKFNLAKSLSLEKFNAMQTKSYEQSKKFTLPDYTEKILHLLK